MVKITSIIVTQAVISWCLIPQYILCAYHKFLWFEVFYKFNGLATECFRSTAREDKSNPCDFYNGVYTIFNCLICFSSIIASIGVGTCDKKINQETRKKILLSWLIAHAIYFLHLILLHIFAVKSILIKLAIGDDIYGWEVVTSLLLLATFTLSMIAGFIFFVIILWHYLKMQRIGGGNLQEMLEERIREDIEWKSDKKKRIREKIVEPAIFSIVFTDVWL